MNPNSNLPHTKKISVRSTIIVTLIALLAAILTWVNYIYQDTKDLKYFLEQKKSLGQTTISNQELLEEWNGIKYITIEFKIVT